MITSSGNGNAAQVLAAVVMAHDDRGPQSTPVDFILKALGLSSRD